MPAKTLTAKVVKRKDFTDDLFVLKLEPQTNEKFTFKPGQYCTIGFSDAGGKFFLDSEGNSMIRPYSIVSAPYEDFIELFVEYVPEEHGGNLTPLLHQLRVGDSVDLLPRAKGIFTFKPKYKNHVMVSTVTGVVPYVSIIRDYMHRGESGHRFFVLQGASYQDEFGYYGEFCEIMIARSNVINLVYVPTISRPTEDRNAMWHGEKGRVNEIVASYIAMWQQTMDLAPENTLISACGHPGMIAKVKEMAISGGWNFDEERFWKE